MGEIAKNRIATNRVDDIIDLRSNLTFANK